VDTLGVIAIDDPAAEDVRALLGRHLAFARATTLPDEVYALDVDALVDPAVAFFSYRVEGELLGVAALKRIDDEHAEIKSMHTAEAARGRGIGRALLDELIKAARLAGIWTIQTSIFPENRASLALHERCGFRVVGTRERVAKRDGIWRDTVFMEKRL
jgi:putative acetyltransferase